jgi:hypothetical protein
MVAIQMWWQWPITLPMFKTLMLPLLAVLEKLLVSGVSGRLKTKLVDSKICSNVRCTFEAKARPWALSLSI